MKKFLALAALWLMGVASAQAQVNPVTAYTSAANPTSTLQMTSGTSAYTTGQLIASSGTAGSIVVPSLVLPNTTAVISRVRLTNNDTTSTAWPAKVVTVDLWSAAPTFTNGDRAAFLPATGTAGHLAAFTCTMSAEYGDGVYAECPLATGSGTVAELKLASSTIYWTLSTTGSGTTGASKVFTLTAEVQN